MCVGCAEVLEVMVGFVPSLSPGARGPHTPGGEMMLQKQALSVRSYPKAPAPRKTVF